MTVKENKEHGKKGEHFQCLAVTDTFLLRCVVYALLCVRATVSACVCVCVIVAVARRCLFETNVWPNTVNLSIESIHQIAFSFISAMIIRIYCWALSNSFLE